MKNKTETSLRNILIYLVDKLILRFCWFVAGLFTGYLWMAKAFKLI